MATQVSRESCVVNMGFDPQPQESMGTKINTELLTLALKASHQSHPRPVGYYLPRISPV